LIVSGLVTSGLLDLFPGFARFFAVFLLFSFIPGEVLRRLLFGADRSNAEGLPQSFLFGLSFYAVVTWICQLLGVSFSSYVTVLQIISFLFFGILVFWGYRKTRRENALSARRFPSPTVVVLVPSFLIGAFFFFVPSGIGPEADTYDHLGYMRSIVTEDRLLPTGVIAPSSPEGGVVGYGVSQETVNGADGLVVKPDPRKGVFHPMVAAIGALARIDPPAVWQWLTVVLAPLAVVAFAAFASVLLPGYHYTAIGLALFIMFQGGVGREFLDSIAGGGHLALVFYWLIVALSVRCCRTSDKRVLAGVCLLLIGGSLIHFNVATYFILALISLLLFRKVFLLQARGLVSFGLVTLSCMLAFFVWKIDFSFQAPNVIYSHPQGLLYFFAIGDAHFMANPKYMMEQFGLPFVIGLCAVPGLLLLRVHRRFALMSLALSLPPILILLNPYIAPLIYGKASYAVDRLLLAVPAFVVTALILGSMIGWAKRGRFIDKLAVALVVFGWIELLLIGVGSWGTHTGIRSAREEGATQPKAVAKMIGFVNDRVRPGSIVLSDPVTSYTLSAFCGTKVVTVPARHVSPNDPQALSRLLAVRNVLSPHTTQMETIAVVDRFSVDYIVLNVASTPVHEFVVDWDPAAIDVLRRKLGSLKEVFDAVYDEHGFVIYKVIRRSPPDDYTWYPDLAHFEPPPMVLNRCRGDDASGLPHVRLAGALPVEVLPGEEMQLAVAYTRDNELSSQLPLVLYIELQHTEYFADAHSYPGDKYVRRLREWSGGLVRHRIRHRPFDGVFTADTWPIGLNTYETIPIKLPTNLREGTYDLRFKLAYEPLAPNSSVKDLFYNVDSRSGLSCAQIGVRRFIAR